MASKEGDLRQQMELNTESLRSPKGPKTAKAKKNRRMEVLEEENEGEGEKRGHDAESAALQQALRGVWAALRCPNCRAYLYPPVCMCSAGHSLCVECSEDGRCPLPYCRRSLLHLVRNSPLENVALAVLVRCEYSAQGCDVVLPPGEARQHSLVCSRRPQQCPMLNLLCNWIGAANTLARHVQEKHPIHVIRSSETELLVGGPLGTLDTFSVLLCLGDRFLARVRIRERAGGARASTGRQVAAAVQYLGERRSASDFTFDTLLQDVSDCKDAKCAPGGGSANECSDCESLCGDEEHGGHAKRLRRRVLQRLSVLDVGFDLDRLLDTPTSRCFRAPLDSCSCYPAHTLRVRLRIEENLL